MKLSNDLGRDKVVSLVFKLALPAMVAQLINVLYGIIDRMYIGNIPEIGDMALAGVGVCAPIVTLLSSFGTLFGLGGSILMAMHLGEGRLDKAKSVLANSFLMLVISSIISTIVILLTKDKLIMWFGGSANTFEYANEYLTIYTYGTFFAVMALGLNFFITAQGYSTVAMFGVILGAVMNIVLDSIFIIVCGLGVKGAAYATVISQLASAMFIMIFLMSKKVQVKISFKGYSFKRIVKIFKLGLTPFIIIALDSVLIIVLNSALQNYGGQEQGDLLVSTATIAQSFLSLVTGPLGGLTGGTQAILSYNLGAGNTDRIKKAEKIILIVGVVFMTIMMIFAWTLAKYFVVLFTKDSLVMEKSIWAVRVMTLAIIPLAFQYTFVDGFTALGKVGLSLYLSLFRKVVYITSALVLPLIFDAQSIFYAEPLSDLAGCLMSSTCFILIFNKFLAKYQKPKFNEPPAFEEDGTKENI